MDREHARDRLPLGQGFTESPRVQRLAPGKRTLTEGLVVQRREAAAELAASGTAASPRAPLPISASGGSRPTLQMLFGVQRDATAAPAEAPARVHAAAARGTATVATKLPYTDQIQRAFGRHDISGIQAHLGADAAASAREMGARAYATGDHVVLGEGADLHTVAHEAAHVVQQRGGVSLFGGLDGGDSDPYEQHADEVAARVVRGESAEVLLDAHAGGAPAAPAVQRRRVTLTYLNGHGQVDSGMAIETTNLSWEKLEEMLEDDSLSPQSQKELMRAIDAGEVKGGYPGAYEYATAHLEFLRKVLPKFGDKNEFSWLRRITGGGSGTLTGKRDADGIKTNMSEEEYDATAEISAGFYQTAARLNKEVPRKDYLTLYRGFTIPASKEKDASDKLAERIAGFSDVLPSSASWQREQSINMSKPGDNESAVLVYMSIPPDHPIVIMSYPDNEQPKDERPKSLDIGQAEVLVAASTYTDVNVFRVEDLPQGKLRYHVSVTLEPRDPKVVMEGIETARKIAQSKRKPKAQQIDIEADALVAKFGEKVAGQIRSATETGGEFADLEKKLWKLVIIGDEMFPYTFTSV